MKKKNKTIIIIIIIVSMILFLSAGTLAYWYWSNIGDAKNLVVSIAGVRNSDINYSEGESHFLGDFQPTGSFCESSSTTLSFSKKERIKDINLDATIHLDINSIGTNISNSKDVYWVVTSGESGITCEEGLYSSTVLSFGTFNGVQTGEVLDLLSHIPVTTSTQTFTVWIWIDELGSNLDSLSGELLDVNVWTEITMVYNTPNKPELDSGMIPVTIANDGTVTTVSADDPTWYNYQNKEWANVVLVTDSSRSNYKNNIGKTVSQGDILAYYVWIPRYRYKMNISTGGRYVPAMTCGDIKNPTRKQYPMCYSYNITGTDREKLVNSLSQDWCFDRGFSSVEDCIYNPYLEEMFVNEVEKMLSGGTFVLEYSGLGFYLEDYIIARGLDIILENENYSFISDKLLESSYTNPPLMDILFESKSSIRVFGDAINTYYSHPAFWWDDDNDGIVDNNEMLSGIWVGKFESNPEKNSECLTKLEQIKDQFDYTNTTTDLCNNSTQNPTILPNVTSLRYQDVKNQFLTSRNISKNGNIYGLNNETINAHLMKNRDWGAVMYLSDSIYGKATEVKKNNNVWYITGCGTTSPFSEYDSSSTTVCQNKYGTVTRYLQSTTGNITGIFDMAGGSYDRVMGHYGDTINYGSGFEELPELKYYDLYSETNFDSNCPLETCEGHALNNGFGGIAGFSDSSPWVTRGGNFVDSNAYIWVASSNDGYSKNDHNVSWRSVLVPGFGD